MTDPTGEALRANALPACPEGGAELLPCPFCGEQRIFLNKPSKDHRYGAVNCPACMAFMPGAVSDQDELVRSWNTRSADRLQAEVARLREQIADADKACIQFAAQHGLATGHGDTVADMIREFSAQIKEQCSRLERNRDMWKGQVERQAARLTVVHETLAGIKRWAEQKCPCENEEPDPCPLCGASVESLEACKAYDGTMPRVLRDLIDNALAQGER